MDDYLVKVIADAARSAFADLFKQHPEHYYYCSLITTGNALPPAIVVWSKEALDKSVAVADNQEKAVYYLKWFYADSPYYAYGYDEYFGAVVDAFNARCCMDYENSEEWDSDEWDREYCIRLSSMEEAVRLLDSEGLFGTGTDRLSKVVNVEVMPPDYTNTERALRLNPKEALRDWLVEIAEELD